MSLRLHDTIAALASAAGPAPRGIVRISGPDAIGCVGECFGPDDAHAWQNSRGPRRHPGQFLLPALSTQVSADILAWPNARSYTGEPMAEIHTIGSPPVLEAVLSALHGRGVRPARPGEFTLRAFLSGRVDLTQAEAVLGVIDAADHVELEAALQQLAGGVSARLAIVRGDLLDLLADLEAGLDFVEEDIEFVDPGAVTLRLQAAADAVQSLLNSAGTRIHTTGRRNVVLAGLPNAGKSTLFNALLHHEAALVSEIEGTTRDYLSAPLDIDGIAIDLVDTAGWENRREGIGGLAQSLRNERFAKADLLIWCTPADASPETRQRDSSLLAELRKDGFDILEVLTKSDLPATVAGSGTIPASGHSGEGLDRLLAAVTERLSTGTMRKGQLLGTTAARCADSLNAAVRSLRGAVQTSRDGAGEELIAIEIRDALEQLGAILGAVYTDDILDRIFSKFCIGK